MTPTAQADDNQLSATQAFIPAGLVGYDTGVVDANVTGFDYAVISADAAQLARQAVEKIRQRQQRVSREIIEIGADLLRVKDALGHGHFRRWLEAEFGWTDRTARNYMRVAEAFGAKSETVSVLPPTALYKLAAKTTPADVVAQVINDLEDNGIAALDVIEGRIESARQSALIEKREAKRRALRASTRARRRQEDQRCEEERECGIEDEISPEHYRTAYLLRADQAREFACYSGPVSDEIIAMARQVAAAWSKLADDLGQRQLVPEKLPDDGSIPPFLRRGAAE